MADYAAGGSAPPDQGVKCQALSTDTTIRVAPMERFCGGWSTEHFNDKLRLPDGSNAGQGMVVQLEGMARECLVIALSPYHKYELGKTYAIHFGANGNMQTVLRRHVNYNEAVDNGKLSAGVGKVPGKHVIGVLDDSMYNMLRSGVDAVKYVGLGNSALQRNARDLKVRNVRVMGIPPQYQEGIPLDESGGFGFVNVNNLGYGTSHTSQQSTGMPNDSELLAEYERERAKAKARAEKFGIEYKEPAADAFLKWSEARRLRANPERGFITGIDTFSVEEKQKALNRKERFAQDERKRKGRDDDGGDGNDEEDAEIIDDDVDDVAEWEKTKKDPLPVEQAWENWKIVQRFRVDCPAGLLNKDGTQATEDEIELTADAANDVWHGVSTVGDPGNDSAMVTTDNFIPRKVSIVPTKIHLFSNDWAPFKQIRTDDVMAYFRDYGPSYVEWLGELSCNVLFEDKHSAARAFAALSQELPSPPPELSNDDEKMDEAEDPKDDGVIPTDEFGRAQAVPTDEFGRAPEAVIARAAIIAKDGEPKVNDILPDFGGMGWRFCKWTARKVSNDRYGRRGTRARVLMRLATTLDVLDDRPTHWPKPPPGFSTKRVLMPWHDYSGKRKKGRHDTKRRRQNDSRRHNRREPEYNVEDRLASGLIAGRAGHEDSR